MSEEQQLDTLLEALDAYSEAQAEYRACMGRDGYERGYYCWDAQQKREQRRAAVGAALNAYIDRRVTAARTEATG